MTAQAAGLVVMAQAVTSDGIKTQADALLLCASRMLYAGSEDSVSALTSVLPIDQAAGGLAAFRKKAERFAETHNLDVEISANRTHLRVRFSRRHGE